MSAIFRYSRIVGILNKNPAPAYTAVRSRKYNNASITIITPLYCYSCVLFYIGMLYELLGIYVTSFAHFE